MPQLPFTMQNQQASQWCWSAVSVSVDDFRGPSTTWTQCLLVNDLLARFDCCGSPVAAACDKPNQLSTALTRVGRLNPPLHPGRLADAIIMQEIDGGRPVCLRIQWNGGTLGHFVAVIGYDDSDPQDLQYVIADPFHGQSTVDASTFPALYKSVGAVWTHSYLIA